MPKTVSNAPKPDVICSGEVGEVGELQEPKNGGKYHSFKVELNPYQNGQKANIFLRFWPEAFASDFDPAAIEPDFNIPSKRQREKKGIADTPEALANDELRSKHFIHSLNIGSDAGDAFLQVLIGERWDEYNEALKAVETAGNLDAEHIRQVTAGFIKGRPVIYQLQQQKRDGQLSQYYEVARLYTLDDSNLKRFDREKFQSKRPTVITFSVDAAQPA